MYKVSLDKTFWEIVVKYLDEKHAVKLQNVF